jgi:Flp pilus assembly protein TadD
MNKLIYVLGIVLLSACSSQPAPSPASEQSTSATASITVTSASTEAIAHFQKGEGLLQNLRTVEAAEEFAQALKADPNFVLARAYLGQATPGPDGLKELEAAAAGASSLPEPERLLIQGTDANRRGDNVAATTAFTRLAELTPNDWRAHYALGQIQLQNQKYAEGAQSLKKATELNANAGGAQNMLGYAALRQGDTAAAIAAFEQYARILPQEPNAQDSLGEALLAAGQFKEAEAAFRKALELSPRFWNAHEGIAYARFYAGDWKGGRVALGQAKEGATRLADKLSVDDEMAAAELASRNTAAALNVLDGMEKTEGAQLFDLSFVPVRRALVFTDARRTREALTSIAAALATADGGKLDPGASRNLRRAALRARVLVETQLGDVAAAEKTVAALDQEASSRPDDPAAMTAMHYGRGLLAAAQGDAASVKAHFDQCSRQDDVCKWQGVIAAEKAGDKVGAAAAREQVLKVYGRDPNALIVRSRLTPRT